MGSHTFQFTVEWLVLLVLVLVLLATLLNGVPVSVGDGHISLQVEVLGLLFADVLLVVINVLVNLVQVFLVGLSHVWASLWAFDDWDLSAVFAFHSV